jgi:hypothetical protein
MINRAQQSGFALPEWVITAVIPGIFAAKVALFFISILE